MLMLRPAARAAKVSWALLRLKLKEVDMCKSPMTDEVEEFNDMH